MTPMLWRQTATALRILIVFTVLCGVVYPLAVYAVAHVPGLAGKAEGSVITGQVITGQDGTPVGSSLIGVDPVPANPAADPFFHTRPSASGLDPYISPAYAQLQVARVARVTGLSEDTVRDLLARATSGRILGFLGEPTVNVTDLNLLVQQKLSATG